MSVAWAKLRQDQEDLARRIKIKPLKDDIEFVAGCDCGIMGDVGIGVMTVLSWPALDEIEWQHVEERLSIPYRSGFLGFREAPLLIKAYRKLKTKPDLILVDGQGIAHPRMVGLASHLGVMIETPTIGCAKSRLIGDYRLPGLRRGSFASLTKKGKKIGYVLRTREGVRCLFVSPGHLTDFDDTIRWVLRLCPRYRIPRPIRLAHNHARSVRENMDSEL